MLSIALAALLVVCLTFSACQTVLPTPLLEVQEQAAGGTTVVFRVVIDRPGWLVLRPAVPAGEPVAGSELARAYLPDAGEYASITMAVGGAVVGNADVSASLHYDDPADQAFTFSPGSEDDPLVLVDSNEVTVSFTMRGVTPYVDVEDTGTGQGTVMIEVAIDRPGWLVLHPATGEAKPDSATVLASTHLAEAGVYPGFEVTVPADVARTYFAVLYYDDPADADFTYAAGGSEDPPVRVGGVAVEEAFTVGE